MQDHFEATYLKKSLKLDDTIQTQNLELQNSNQNNVKPK